MNGSLNRWRLGTLAVAVALLVPSCGALRKLGARGEKGPDEEAEVARRGPVPIGRVEVVHERGGFVLVRPLGGVGRALERGTVVEARSQDGGVVELTMSPERNRAFLVADFDEVPPAVGDVVVFVPPEPPSEEDAGEPGILQEAPAVGIDAMIGLP